jgi:hypothetical protein
MPWRREKSLILPGSKPWFLNHPDYSPVTVLSMLSILNAQPFSNDKITAWKV